MDPPLPNAVRLVSNAVGSMSWGENWMGEFDGPWSIADVDPMAHVGSAMVSGVLCFMTDAAVSRQWEIFLVMFEFLQ